MAKRGQEPDAMTKKTNSVEQAINQLLDAIFRDTGALLVTSHIRDTVDALVVAVRDEQSDRIGQLETKVSELNEYLDRNGL